MASLISLHQNNMQSSEDSMLKSSPKQTTIDLVGGIRCNICLLTFATKKDYDSHYVSHPNVKEIIYTCNICYKEIAGYPSFRGHCYTNHVIKDRFKCEHCLKQFSKLPALKEHINTVHKFKCPSCSKEFPTKKELLLHRIIHNDFDQPPYKCTICKINIDTVDECKKHVELHLQFLYSCPICNENISDKTNAGDHMKQHFGDTLSDDEVVKKEITKTSEDTFIEQLGGIFCELCSTVLKNRVEFDAHFSCEHGEEDIVYMCVVCGNTFEKYSVFYNHCYGHSVKDRYSCAICQKSFPRASLLATHTVACQQAGATNGKPFACTVCDHRFGGAGRWREHMRDVHGLTRIPCLHRGCELTFDTPKQLILHQQSHDVTIRHYCYQCRLVFTTIAACERHMNVHRKKIYFCPVCKRNYWDKYLIMKHVSQHFETVLHVCKLCGKLYNAKRRLAEHMKIHLNVKSHSCKYCDKTFVKLSHLEHHLNTHTGSKPYKCPVCVKTFANYPNWRKHVRRMHHEESINFQKPLVDRKESIDEEGPTVEMVADEKTEKSSNITDDSFVNTDGQIPIDDQNSDIGTIINIVNHSDNADCLSDIDHAKASIDFANVKLETYIFSVTNDDKIGAENGLSIPDGKDLFNENNADNAPIGKDLFDGNSEEKAQIENHLFNGNSRENNTIGNHLFNGNGTNGENNSIASHLFNANANSGENNPIGNHLFNGNGTNGENISIASHLFSANANSGENNPIGSHLFNGNANSGENNPIGSHLFNGNSKENNPIGTHLFNGISEKNNPIVSHMFNGNNEENNPIGSHLFNGNRNNGGNIQIGRNLFNENNGENVPICSYMCAGNSAKSTPISEELFNGNNGDGATIGTDLFSENNKENVSVRKDLYHRNSEENVHPVDILEYIAEMPENNSLFVPVIGQEPLGPSAAQPAEVGTYPREYGPEFNTGFDACASGFIDLDDHMLPHIDPLLTIKDDMCNKMYVQTPNSQGYADYNVTVETTDYENAPKWEPPIITKLYDEYAYGYGEMTDANRLSIMNTDIF